MYRFPSHDRAVKNEHWPNDLPFGFVYGTFLNAIVQDRIELKGYNVASHISAFKKWITQMGVKDNLYKVYYQSNPEARPKELKGRDEGEEDEKTVELRAEGYVNETPETVERLIGILEALHGDQEAVLSAITNGNMKSYRRRLYNTRQKYMD